MNITKPSDPLLHLMVVLECVLLVVSRYHLKDVVVGKVYFLLVRIKIKHMELNIVKRESSGSGVPASTTALPSASV